MPPGKSPRTLASRYPDLGSYSRVWACEIYFSTTASSAVPNKVTNSSFRKRVIIITPGVHRKTTHHTLVLLRLSLTTFFRGTYFQQVFMSGIDDVGQALITQS